MTENKIEQILFSAIAELNLTIKATEKIKENLNEIIYGKNSKLDSLTLINFLLLVEEKINMSNLNCPNLFNYIEDNTLNVISLQDLLAYIKKTN
jgi:hypothetical protein